MPALRPAIAVSLLSAGLAAAGCSAGVTSTAQPSSPTAAATTAPASTAPASTAGPSGTGIPVPGITVTGLPGDGTAATATGGGSGGGTLPAGFPLPPGTTVGPVVDDGGETAASLTVPDGARAVTFWKSALPAAGFSVTSAETIGTAGEIRFSGHGCAGNSQLAINGTRVAFQCDRG